MYVCVCLVAGCPNPPVPLPRAGPLKHTPADRAKSANVCCGGCGVVCMHVCPPPTVLKGTRLSLLQIVKDLSGCMYKRFVYVQMYMDVHVTDSLCNRLGSEFSNTSSNLEYGAASSKG